MTPSNEQKPATEWWQTLLISVANVAVSALIGHYLGPVAGGGAVVAGTAIAHRLPSPAQLGR